MLCVKVDMPDESVWAVPVEVVAQYRAEYMAKHNKDQKYEVQKEFIHMDDIESIDIDETGKMIVNGGDKSKVKKMRDEYESKVNFIMKETIPLFESHPEEISIWANKMKWDDVKFSAFRIKRHTTPTAKEEQYKDGWKKGFKELEDIDVYDLSVF